MSRIDLELSNTPPNRAVALAPEAAPAYERATIFTVTTPLGKRRSLNPDGTPGKAALGEMFDGTNATEQVADQEHLGAIIEGLTHNQALLTGKIRGKNKPVSAKWLKEAGKALKGIPPEELSETPFIKAFDTDSMTIFGQNAFFDSTHSFARGYRFNFANTWPVFYLAGDSLTASFEIGARTRNELLGPLLLSEKNPCLLVQVKVSAFVLNLTNKGVRDSIGVSLDELLISTDRWDTDMKNGIWAITHHLGALALKDGRFGGILFPSYPAHELGKMGKKRCLAVFMDKKSVSMALPLHSQTKIEVVDKHDVLKNMGLNI